MKTKAQELTKITTRINWSRQWIPIALILLLATGLYLYQLGTESLWLDELSSIRSAKELELTSERPLYYILLRIWMQFGTSDAWLRGLSVFFALGSVFLTYQLGRRLAGQTTGLIAALLLALSPLFINHAQEVRMYTLGTFLGLGGTLALTRALEHPTTSSMRWWASARLLTILTAPLNFTLLLPDIVLFGLRFRGQRRVLLAFGKWLLLVGILWLPSAIALALVTPSFMGGWVADLVSHPRINDVAYTLAKFTVRWFDLPVNLIARFYTEGFIKAYAIMVMCLLGVALVNKKHSVKLTWAAAWAFLPLAIIFLISNVSSSIWIERYLLFVCPYVFILLAAGFTRIWHWQRTVAIVIVLIYTVALGGGLEHYYTVEEREDWRSLVQMISIKEEPGDTISIISTDKPPLDHYYHGSGPVYFIKDEAVPLNKIDKLLMELVVDNLPPVKSRLWVGYRHVGSEARHRMYRTVVREQFHVQQHWIFMDMDLFLVTPHSTSTQGL